MPEETRKMNEEWVTKKRMKILARGPLSAAEMVTTAHGRVRAEAGDYVLLDPVSLDTWPIKPDIYANTYEKWTD